MATAPQVVHTASVLRQLEIPTGARAKLSAIKPTFEGILSLAGERAGAFEEALSDDTRALCRRPYSVSEWVPLEHVAHLCETAFTVVYRGNLQRCYEQGEVVFARNLRSFHSLFIRLLSPEHFVKRMSSAYAGYYTLNGVVGPPTKIDRGIEVTVAGVGWASPISWQILAGNLAAPFKLMQLRDVETAIVAGGGHSRTATLRATWR